MGNNNGEGPLHFVVETKNKRSLMKEMEDLYQQIFVQNKVKQTGNVRVHKTRSKKEKCNPYIIPPVLIEIEKEFWKYADEYIDDAAFTQTDSEMGDGDEDDIDSDDDMEN